MVPRSIRQYSLTVPSTHYQIQLYPVFEPNDLPPFGLGYSTLNSPSIEIFQTFRAIGQFAVDVTVKNEQQRALLCLRQSASEAF